MESLRGKVALVTGGSRGIGLAIARALVAEGVHGGRHRLQRRAPVGGASRTSRAPGPAAVETLRADVRRYEDVERADRRDRRPLRRPRHPRQQRRRRHLRRRRRDDARAVGRGHRHESDRRLQRLPRRDSAPAAPRRRLHHQHQQPRRQEPVRRRRGVLRVEGRAERVQRGADAGSPVRQHPRQLRDAGLGRDRVLAAAIAAKGADWKIAPTTSPRSCVNLLRTPARSLPSRVELRPSKPVKQMTSVFDKHRDALEHHETMMGTARGRLAVALDLLTDSLALVGQHGVYCRSERFPGKPRMDIALVLEQLDDAKQLVQSAMEELRSKTRRSSRLDVHPMCLRSAPHRPRLSDRAATAARPTLSTATGSAARARRARRTARRAQSDTARGDQPTRSSA